MIPLGFCTLSMVRECLGFPPLILNHSALTPPSVCAHEFSCLSSTKNSTSTDILPSTLT